MINVSNEFRKLMQTKTDFKENAEITFADGTVLALAEKDFTISNNSVTDASETNGIPLGVALCRSIQIELMNDDDRFSTYDFFGAVIRLYLTFQLSETVEKIEYGTFTVLTPETYGETVIITALDDMYKADKAYSTSLIFPTTIKAMLVDACNALDISLGTTSFLNDDFMVQSMPTDITYRQLIGYIAMIAGGNARIDTTGRLRIISYDFSALDDIYNSILDGGKYNPWNNPTDLDGGSFNPWNVGDVADGGTFGDRNSFHVLGSWSNLKIDTDDVVITGVQATYTDSDNEEHTVIYGTEGYVLSVENPLITGQELSAIDLIGNVMVGGRFRQFSGDLVANPTCEFMDNVVVLDRKGNAYVSFLTDINFQFFGFTTISNSAEPTLRNSAKTYSQATQTLVAARKLIKNERTAREQAVAQLAKDLANSSGLFMTQEKQSDGSIIYYMHDKPTLAESMIVWKLTSLAFGISTDGGKTYPYGFTVDGETVTRLLYAEGIDADYIDTGALRISDSNGNILFLADYDTKEVRINADKVLIGSQTVKNYVDFINNDLQSQIDGNIETFTGSDVPTLSNYPANTWTTTDLKDKHIGDLYYVSGSDTTQGFAYRFQKNGTTYSWVLIKDSEVTKALQDAADAMAKANSVGQDLEQNYSTTIVMNSAIATKADEISLSVSKTYETITNSDKKYDELSAKITVNADAITAEVNRATNAEESLSSRITQTAEAITSEVTRAKGAEESLSSKITQNASSITSEVTRAKNAEESLSSRITQTAEAITLKVSKGDVSSQLSVESGAISIKSDRFSWTSTYSSLTSKGKLTAKDVDLTGKITATSGEIGGFTIGTSEIYSSNKSTLNSSNAGVYIGSDGISVGTGLNGPAFKITSDGDISINDPSGSIVFGSGTGTISITANGIQFGSSSISSKLTKDKISVFNNYIDEDSIRASSASGSYTELTWQEIKAYFSSSAYCALRYNELEFASSATFDILSGTTNLVHLYKGHCTYGGDVATLGNGSGSISFFGSSTGNTKQTVANITTPSSATASTIATKLNDLLTALRSYKLIG